MPFHYSISTSSEKIEDFFNVGVPENYRPRYNAAPTQLLPVITSENPEGLSFFYWGINPGFVKSKTVSQKLTHAHSDQLLVKASLRKNLKQRRCVVIADGWYDWKKLSKKGRTPYWFHMSDGEPFAIAALWDEFDNEQGEKIHTFMLITTPANAAVADITDRMPAILDDEFIIEWLNDSNTEESVHGMIKPQQGRVLDRYTVNPKVADAANDTPDLLTKVPPADQFGNLTLFG